MKAARSISYPCKRRKGYWHGELEADTTLESDYIYYLHVLGKADPERIAKLANYVRRKQLPDGGWPIYPGGLLGARMPLPKPILR